MLAATLFAIVFAQTPAPPTDCAVAMARSTSTATAQICLAEAELERAQAAPPNGTEWKARLRGAAEIYKRAFALPADESVKDAVLERLLLIFDKPMLNDATEMLAAFDELVRLKPTDAGPLLRFARYQETRGELEAAEELLLSARRLRPDQIEPFRMLAQFYARRAGAMQAAARKLEVQEETPPGAPDSNGVFQVGGGIAAPRRFGNASYPSEALAAGIGGAVSAEITVNEAGVVTDARVLKSVPLLDDAALKAVKEWRYDPTIVDGKAVPIKMTVTVNFSLAR